MRGSLLSVAGNARLELAVTAREPSTFALGDDRVP